MKREIKAEIIAGSLNEHGQKITTWVGTMPRMIWAEFLTHRVFSRNAASSRAIPALKMIADIEADPFIPVAWQKEHKGMQGTEYIEDPLQIEYERYDWASDAGSACLEARDRAGRGVTKQLTNRPLEPFQWYTAIFTTTETENFFNLRCPQYHFIGEGLHKSRKDVKKALYDKGQAISFEDNDLNWLRINEGQGEIHISLLAEAMWDSMNEYDYKQLKAGEWHIPFGDRFDEDRLEPLVLPLIDVAGTFDASMDSVKKVNNELKIKIATARCARVSYNNFEGKDDYQSDIKLYDILKSSGHFSPFEHCARAMTKDEYDGNIRGYVSRHDGYLDVEETSKGWSGNFRGFVQLRQEL